MCVCECVCISPYNYFYNLFLKSTDSFLILNSTLCNIFYKKLSTVYLHTRSFNRCNKVLSSNYISLFKFCFKFDNFISQKNNSAETPMKNLVYSGTMNLCFHDCSILDNHVHIILNFNIFKNSLPLLNDFKLWQNTVYPSLNVSHLWCCPTLSIPYLECKLW